MMRFGALRRDAAIGCAAITLCLCGSSALAQDAADGPKAASAPTVAANAAMASDLPFSDRDDYAAIRRGLIAEFTGRIVAADGSIIYDARDADFLKADRAAATVNPSLWRHSGLHSLAGLFRVSDRVYQLRGFDLANMTVIEGDHGLIVVDPLTSTEAARTALEFYFRHRPKRPVVAVIFTHSHIDHFGGVGGVIDEAEVKAGKVKVFAPKDFLKEAVSENVLAGNAMLRRAQYQAGSPLPRSATGQVGAGLGPVGAGRGEVSLIAPTDEISQAYETRTIDGVTFEFQYTPGTEAPAEMDFYLPQWRVLCMAENVVRTMHNVLTPRGALVRDPKAWSGFIDAALARYGDRTDVLIASHLWPTFGGDSVRTVLADARDMYAYLNNRALFLLNQGKTPDEIGEEMRSLPGALRTKWYLRGYYGTASFNGRAVYQRYLGFYDGNPADLDPLPPVASAKRYVDALGGRDRVLALVRAAAAKGDYRWAAEIGKQLVFAFPDDSEVRGAQADVLEQLGYQAESAIWRNIYLTGADELRHGVKPGGLARANQMTRALTPAMYFDLLSVRLDSDKAQGHDMTLTWKFPDLGQSFAITIRNGVMTWRENAENPVAQVTVSMDKTTLDRINGRQLTFPDGVKSGLITITGDAAKLGQLMSYMTAFDPQFPIVTR